MCRDRMARCLLLISVMVHADIAPATRTLISQELDKLALSEYTPIPQAGGWVEHYFNLR